MDGTTTTFGKQHGVFISRKIIAVIAAIFVIGIIATGLLAYSLTSCPSNLQEATRYHHQDHHNQSSSSFTTTESSTDEEYTSTPIEDTTSSITKKLDVRLPRSVFPKSYHIRIIPFIFEGNFSFHGEVDIVVIAKEETNNITLHFNDITYDESSISVIALSDDSVVSVERIDNDTSRQFLVLHLENALHFDKLYKVHIKYTGVLNDILQGFYRSSYQVGNQTR